jgi:hypothetical protein
MPNFASEACAARNSQQASAGALALEQPKMSAPNRAGEKVSFLHFFSSIVRKTAGKIRIGW